MVEKVWDMVSVTNPSLMADLVVCDTCGTKMLVDMGETVCPFCRDNKVIGLHGHLSWLNTSKGHVLRSDYYDCERYSKYVENRLTEIDRMRNFKNLDLARQYCENATFSMGQYEEMEKVETIYRIVKGLKDGKTSVSELVGYSICPHRIFSAAPEYCSRSLWETELFPQIPFNENTDLICLECWVRALGGEP